MKSTYRAVVKGWQEITSLGVKPMQSSYERGLIKVSNKNALLILLIVNLLVLLPALFSKLIMPILLVNSICFPLALLFNQRGWYLTARHYQLGVLYAMMLLINLYRGLESGILVLSIPCLLLAFVYFQNRKSLLLHLSLLVIILLGIFLYAYNHPPIAAYAADKQRYAFLLHLIIGLTLSSIFIHFHLRLHHKYQSELLRLNSTKNKLLSVIGHDLKDPMNSLKGILFLLNNRHLSQDEFYQLAGRLKQTTDTMHSTLDNLLQWAVSQMDGFKVNPVAVDLKQLVDELELVFAEIAERKNIRVHNSVPDTLVAHCDEDHIRLVLRNLLSNAIKFSLAGSKITVGGRSGNDHTLQLYVRDAGTGMPAETLQQLFRQGLAYSQRGTQGETGTGLGLQLCREMMEINQGRIWAESQMGSGSVFYLQLPRFTLKTAAVAAMTDTMHQKAESPEGSLQQVQECSV